MTHHILLERPADHPEICVLRMNRPEKRNAITRAMYGEMALALADADADETVAAAIILGVPGCFSAGNDLADFIEIARDSGEAKNVTAFLHELARFGKPLLSGVDGLAIGIGTTLNFHCDLTFATPRSVFRTPFTDLGLVPEAASSQLGPRIMGYQRAFAMLVNGIAFSADEARQAGLVWKIVDEERLEDDVMAAAVELAARPRQAVLSARRMIKGDVGEMVACIDREMELFLERLQSAEASAILNAFLARGR